MFLPDIGFNTKDLSIKSKYHVAQTANTIYSFALIDKENVNHFYLLCYSKLQFGPQNNQ